jgi:hypothetical protein
MSSVMNDGLRSTRVASSPSRSTRWARGSGVPCSVPRRVHSGGRLNSARVRVAAAETGHESWFRLAGDGLVATGACSESHFDIGLRSVWCGRGGCCLCC